MHRRSENTLLANDKKASPASTGEDFDISYAL